jgi:hypothetical protein
MNFVVLLVIKKNRKIEFTDNQELIGKTHFEATKGIKEEWF